MNDRETILIFLYEKALFRPYDWSGYGKFATFIMIIEKIEEGLKRGKLIYIFRPVDHVGEANRK